MAQTKETRIILILQIQQFYLKLQLPFKPRNIVNDLSRYNLYMNQSNMFRLCEFKYDFNIEFNSSKKKPRIEKKNQITGQFKQKIKEHDNSNRKLKRIS